MPPDLCGERRNDTDESSQDNAPPSGGSTIKVKYATGMPALSRDQVHFQQRGAFSLQCCVAVEFQNGDLGGQRSTVQWTTARKSISNDAFRGDRQVSQ